MYGEISPADNQDVLLVHTCKYSIEKCLMSQNRAKRRGRWYVGA